MAEKLIEDNNESSHLNTVALVTNMLGHPIRLKMVGVINEREGIQWSQLVNELKKNFGELNPNTISFHLSKLVSGKIVEKKGSDNYLITKDASESSIVKAVLSELKKRGH